MLIPLGLKIADQGLLPGGGVKNAAAISNEGGTGTVPELAAEDGCVTLRRAIGLLNFLSVPFRSSIFPSPRLNRALA